MLMGGVKHGWQPLRTGSPKRSPSPTFPTPRRREVSAPSLSQPRGGEPPCFADSRSRASSLAEGAGSVVEPFDTPGPLFDDPEIAEALSAPSEDHLFESLVLGGLVDE